ncbi:MULTISPECIES: head decoration protein [Methylobacterium]|uniref:head decoration protein n=1 Tax=Methylobacterium TaxID=407 RepID=UPI00272E88D4|nr:head decoration protein [Methylobacterium sp.]
MGIPKSTEFRTNVNEYRYGSDNNTETKVVTIQAGHVYARGSVLGRIDATGEYVLCAKQKDNGDAVADGSQRARLVLKADVDTTGGAKPGVTYAKGTLSTSWVKLGRGHTIASVEDDLRDLSGIYLNQPAIPAVG